MIRRVIRRCEKEENIIESSLAMVATQDSGMLYSMESLYIYVQNGSLGSYIHVLYMASLYKCAKASSGE